MERCKERSAMALLCILESIEIYSCIPNVERSSLRLSLDALISFSSCWLTDLPRPSY